MPRQWSEIPQPDGYSLDVQHQPYPSAQAVLFEVWRWFWPQTHCQDLWNELCNSFKSDRTEINICVDISDSLHFFVLHLYWDKETFDKKHSFRVNLIQRRLFTNPLESFISVLMLSAVFCLKFHLPDTGSLELSPTKLEATVIPTFFFQQRLTAIKLCLKHLFSLPP